MVKKISKFRFLLHNKTLFKAIKRKFFYCPNPNWTDEEKENYEASFIFNYRFDCRNPRTFNEHLVWLKLNYRNDLWKKCADKLGSKCFLDEIGLGQYVPTTYGIYKNSSEINLDFLPNKFVLKTNHDCGSVFVCEKGVTNFKIVFAKLDEALEKKYASEKYEWVYQDIKPVIFAEELLHSSNKISNLVDYKLFTINGKFVFGFAVEGRNEDARSLVFDRNFTNLNTEYLYLKPSKKSYILKPDCFDEMIKLSESVAKYFKSVRVDFYWTDKGPRIGELTFFSMSGMGPFTKKKYDFCFGKMFDNVIIDRVDKK